MYWSVIENTGGAQPVSFALANQIPEPAPLALMGLGLLGIAWKRRNTAAHRE
jgi:hypothetical protein